MVLQEKFAYFCATNFLGARSNRPPPPHQSYFWQRTMEHNINATQKIAYRKSVF